ncbi:hypothetical protein [Saccharopolyspora spinosa]|uniref:Uncharacterized protein n=1 Tax=Saccharopolyspora spinosa TaxID=60894 RepID=A0A2N3Y104_SACSN|nr:hypothetical protein [Saccharopolyspora spinosa]PKW16597.1 hypothetical protein A8926_4442 [Saccharopolyspora spinosa]
MGTHVDMAGCLLEVAGYAHSACASSGPRAVTAVEFETRRDALSPVLASDDFGGDVEVVATVWDTGQGTLIPCTAPHQVALPPSSSSQRS